MSKFSVEIKQQDVPLVRQRFIKGLPMGTALSSLAFGSRFRLRDGRHAVMVDRSIGRSVLFIQRGVGSRVSAPWGEWFFRDDGSCMGRPGLDELVEGYKLMTLDVIQVLR